MTIKDVAAMAGVSPAAVSRYLNGGSLSEEKRQRIQTTIEETGYRPTVAAQMMRTGHQRQIGVLIPKLYSDAVVQVTAGVTRYIQDFGYMSVLGDTHADEQKELEYLSIMEANRAAGVIVMGTAVTPRRIEAYKACSIPVVVTGQNISGMSCVYHDDYAATHELMRLIVGRRQRIGYIGVTDHDPRAGKLRREAAQAAFGEDGRDEKELLTEIADFNAESGYHAMQRMLRQDPTVDGVMCATDAIAFGAMRALYEAGKQPGVDVSIAGIGDSWIGEYAMTPLTTARLYFKQCGEDAARLLLAMIDAAEKDEPVATRQICLDYELVERGSI